MSRPPPVPEALVGEAIVPGFPHDRHIHGYREAEFIADYQTAMRAAPLNPAGVAILSLSGGGPNGAFGAGVLVGWSELGTRPQFQVVTGVSTGALAAPFAFLGPAYDDRLTKAYTTIHDADLFIPEVKRALFRLLRVDSLTSNKPMDHVLAALIDQPMLEAIGREYTRGRRLYVCTHEMVSGHAVYWNLSAIAASGRPDALELFLKILIASASLPIVFPPQYFEVEVGGERHTEIHMDGGLSRQAFFHMNGARAGLAPRADGTSTPLTAYLIRNGRVRSKYDAIDPTVVPIALRTIEALVNSEGVGDLYRIYSQTLEEQATYQLMMIPDNFPLKHHGMFDPTFMRRLFDVGCASIKSAQPWQPRPPFLSSKDGS
ncbi:patatin-like phospholipase family protein [Oleiharenicola lentus]|uniref:patatin-like phospholipase family protein n=1 Tax=Oleiharenicola lentus TaxID=2508720 RepID=UPI003F671E6F